MERRLTSYINVFDATRNQSQQLMFERGLVLKGDDGSELRLGSAVRQGGNGVIFRATRQGAKRTPCAVKFLKQLDDARRDRFSNEVAILKQLDHPRICRCYGSGVQVLGKQQVEVPWMAMDLGGRNFREEIDQCGPLDVATVCSVGMDACDALAHVHKLGLIHRDLKPQNFVWSTDDDSPEFLLIDFGIAKRIDQDVSGRPMDQFTQQTEFVGPVHFSSPELIEYARNKAHLVDTRSDLFQLGLVLWFLATNQIAAGVPSAKKDPSGGGFHKIILGLLATEPTERPNSTTELRQQLEEFQKSLPRRPAG